MLDNAPLRKLEFNGLTIEGYSRAAVQTYWRIPEMKLGFDLGAFLLAFSSTSGSLCHEDAAFVLILVRNCFKPIGFA